MVNMPFSISGYGVSLMDVSVSAVTNTVAYDALGRQIANTDGRGNTTHTEYNAFGQRSAPIDIFGVFCYTIPNSFRKRQEDQEIIRYGDDEGVLERVPHSGAAQENIDNLGAGVRVPSRLADSHPGR